MNVGPPLKPGNRCGHCGRFIKPEWGWEAFDRHIEEECPVGGIFHNGVLRGARVGNGRRYGVGQ